MHIKKTYTFTLLALFIIIILLHVYFPISTTIVHKAFANSPSFVRQEFIDATDDWIFWRGLSDKSQVYSHEGNLVEVDKAKNVSQCKMGEESLSPDIKSVSYISNGKTLNATIWLTSNFEDPPVNDTLDPFQEELKVEISETNLTLDEYADVKIAQIFDPLLGFNIVKNSTMLAGSPAYKVEYNTTRGLNKLNVMEIWTIIGGKSYDFTYSALSDKYLDYLSTVKRMLDSVKTETYDSKIDDNNKSQFNTGDFSRYESPQLSILYPTAWEIPKEEMTYNKVRSGESKIVIFRSPFEDDGLVAPSWHEMTFTMAIDIDSVHDAGTDYRVIYSRVPYNVWTGSWARHVQEISAYDDVRVLEEANNYTIFDKNSQGPKYILFSFDLEKINSPQRYKAVFYITDYFIRDRSFCRMIDTTNWVIIPPPEFSMQASPSSIVLRPGEGKDVELQIKGNTDLQSEASLSVGNSYNATEFNTSLIPSEASIPASGTGTSALHIKALEPAKPKPYTFPIVANISFPTSITNRGGETFSNNRSVNIIESSNLTATVLPPYTDAEKLSNFTNTWITPIQGIWTFLAGVGAAIAPVIVALYRKKKKEKKTDEVGTPKKSTTINKET